MLDLKLDTQGHLEINNYDLQLVSGVDQITQNLSIRLKFILGEWYLDVTQGIPYYEDILIKATNQYRIESILKQEIVDTKNIAEITQFSTEYDNLIRLFTVRFTCKTVDDDEINLEIQL